MKSLFNSQIGLVEHVLDMQLQRQNVITGNLANIETPNYRPRELDFEKELQEAMGLDSKGRMSLTNYTHMPTYFNISEFGPELRTHAKTRYIYGEDRVNLDKEMAKLAKCNLHYSALTQVMTKSFEGLNTIITDAKNV